jgi:hypothetical protein
VIARINKFSVSHPDRLQAKRAHEQTEQLAIYALALTRRVAGLKLFDISCACFNEEEYFGLFPGLDIVSLYANYIPIVPGIRF